MFVIDASGSIRENRFATVLDFVKGAAEELEIHPDRVRVGAMIYADNAYIQFNLNTYRNKDDVLQVNHSISIYFHVMP